MSEEELKGSKAEAGADAPVEGVAEGNSPIIGEKPAKKKKSLGFKILIVVAIVVVVLAGGGGAAYGLFHNTPGFCNLVCHTPMDPYVESYVNGTSINPAQADSGALLGVTVHKNSDQDIRCLTCHTDGIDAQIQEGIAWVSGNYELPLELTLAAQVKEGSDAKDGVAFCLVEGCHEGISSLADLKKSTAGMKRDPHTNHNGNQACGNCHQMHEQSYMMCTQCHADAEVPEGWMTAKDQQAQKKATSGK